MQPTILEEAELSDATILTSLSKPKVVATAGGDIVFKDSEGSSEDESSLEEDSSEDSASDNASEHQWEVEAVKKAYSKQKQQQKSGASEEPDTVEVVADVPVAARAPSQVPEQWPGTHTTQGPTGVTVSFMPPPEDDDSRPPSMLLAAATGHTPTGHAHPPTKAPEKADSSPVMPDDSPVMPDDSPVKLHDLPVIPRDPSPTLEEKETVIGGEGESGSSAHSDDASGDGAMPNESQDEVREDIDPESWDVMNGGVRDSTGSEAFVNIEQSMMQLQLSIENLQQN